MTSEAIADKHQIPWYRRPLPFTLSYLLLMPIGLLILWTGPNYIRSKGQYARMGKGTKTLLSVLGLFIVLLGLARGLNDASKETASSGSDSGGSPPSASSDTPNMRAELITGQFGELAQIVGDDSKPFTVERVVINGRAGDPGCDSAKTNLGNPPILPATLKRGDTALYSGLCGRRVLTADIFTDRGTATFKFHEDGN